MFQESALAIACVGLETLQFAALGAGIHRTELFLCALIDFAPLGNGIAGARAQVVPDAQAAIAQHDALLAQARPRVLAGLRGQQQASSHTQAKSNQKTHRKFHGFMSSFPKKRSKATNNRPAARGREVAPDRFAVAVVLLPGISLVCQTNRVRSLYSIAQT